MEDSDAYLEIRVAVVSPDPYDQPISPNFTIEYRKVRIHRADISPRTEHLIRERLNEKKVLCAACFDPIEGGKSIAFRGDDIRFSLPLTVLDGTASEVIQRVWDNENELWETRDYLLGYRSCLP